MAFVISTLDPQGQTRQFAFELTTLERGFDFLSALVHKGYCLQTACIQDGDQRLALPLAAFDGTPFSSTLQSLQEDWETVLTTSYCEALLREEQIYLARQQVSQIASTIDHHERMISWASQSLHYKTREEKCAFTRQYEDRLAYHQQQLTQARSQAKSKQNWLNQLIA